MTHREKIKQWRETKARIKEEAMVEKGQETPTEDNVKVSQTSKPDIDYQQKQKISEFRILKVMKERLKRTEMITHEVSATLVWEENKAVIENLKQRVECATERGKNESITTDQDIPKVGRAQKI